MLAFCLPIPLHSNESGRKEWVVGGLSGLLQHAVVEDVVRVLNQSPLPAAQLVQARAVPFPLYACAAAFHARTAFENHSSVAQTLSMEWLLWLARDRQVERALEKIGVHAHSNNQRVALLGMGSKMEVERVLPEMAVRLNMKMVKGPRETQRAVDWNALEALALHRL